MSVTVRGSRFFSLSVACFAGLAFQSMTVRGESASPFIPRSVVTNSIDAAEPVPIQLKGIMVLPQGSFFSIYDPAKKSSVWVATNELGHDFVILGYRATSAGDEVEARYRDRPVVLKLKQAK